MAQYITCGARLHPERAQKYNYCMARECQEKNSKGLPSPHRQPGIHLPPAPGAAPGPNGSKSSRSSITSKDFGQPR
jgi:hypothetical protein